MLLPVVTAGENIVVCLDKNIAYYTKVNK